MNKINKIDGISGRLLVGSCGEVFSSTGYSDPTTKGTVGEAAKNLNRSLYHAFLKEKV